MPPTEQAESLTTQALCAVRFTWVTTRMESGLSVALDHEKNRHLGAEAEVLGTLPDVELESRFALPRLVRR